MKCKSRLICFYVWYVLNKTSYKYCSLYIPGAHFSKQFQPVGKWNRIEIECLRITGNFKQKFEAYDIK